MEVSKVKTLLRYRWVAVAVVVGRILALLLLLFSPAFTFGQDLSSLREKKFLLSADTMQLDTLSILPGSLILKIQGEQVDPEKFSFDPVRGLLVWRGEFPQDSLTATYRSMSMSLGQVFRRRSKDVIRSEVDYYANPYTYRPVTQESTDIFGETRLNKTGSISRGVGFGNNQDLTVNSTLSLQLNGKLTDKINVLASVTDDNIPIQPDGNTAQLQEFDQVYIQLYDDKSKLTAGDFIISRPPGYFSTYFKRAQGASFETRQRLGDNYTFFTQTSAALSRGKFARNIISGIEGNQGPYRLRGNENEAFIIVLAGTERVFIDGQEMQRGQENDYTIDYNTAEITFTAKQLINKDKRIAVEFQYTDANYTRSLFQTSTGIENEDLKLYLNFYSEQDAKNQPLQQDLDDQDRMILNQVGDNVNQAVAPGFERVDEYTNDQVLYTFTDTLGYDSVLVRIESAAPQMFRVNFSDVGEGNGNYIQDGFDATGRVFKWVAPDTINGSLIRYGRFEPVRLLIAPKKNQLLMAGGSYNLGENTSASLEVGFSNDDQNTFSDFGDQNNLSHGVFGEINHVQPLNKKPDPVSLRGAVKFESIGNNFSPIEPYRSVEFNRNWNLPVSILGENQDILSGQIALFKPKKYTIEYTLDRFDAGGDYLGLKNNLLTEYKSPGLDVWFLGSILETRGAEESRFTRHRSKIEKSLWVTKLGFMDEREDNLRLKPGTDSLTNSAYKFYDWQFYLTNVDSAKVGYKLFYRERTDFASNFDDYSESTHAVHYGAELALISNPNNQFKATASNRILEITNEELTSQTPERTLLLRLEHNLRALKNTITTSSYYEIGSGLERRQEFVYIFDPTGQGPFTWIDYNDNGIKELNEFETARPEDGERYIRIFTPTDTYERAYSNQFSQTVNLNPAAAWMGKEGIRKVIARFSNQTAFRVQRKTRREEDSDRYNPFLTGIGDNSLISRSSSIRNTFFYNRSSSKFGADYTYSNQAGKNPLTSGFEERESLAHTLRVRYNFTSVYGIILEQETGVRESASDVIDGRNFVIDYVTLKQTFTYQPGTDFRVSLKSDYTEKKNSPDLGGETATLLDFGADMRLNKVESGTLFAQLNFINIKYEGRANNSLAYEMLNGLQNGENYTWGAGIQRNLGKNLQLSLSYNGRKSEEVKAVHTGNVQVRAFF